MFRITCQSEALAAWRLSAPVGYLQPLGECRFHNGGYPIYSGNPQPGYFPVNPHPRYNSGFMPESPLQKNPYAIGKSSA